MTLEHGLKVVMVATDGEVMGEGRTGGRIYVERGGIASNFCFDMPDGSLLMVPDGLWCGRIEVVAHPNKILFTALHGPPNRAILQRCDSPHPIDQCAASRSHPSSCRRSRS